MAKKYTEQEMRRAANMQEWGAFCEDVPAMLRHAADMMERKEKREKKYEFSVHPPEVNGVFEYRAGAELKAFMLKLAGYRDGIIVRREVGEWEEVK